MSAENETPNETPAEEPKKTTRSKSTSSSSSSAAKPREEPAASTSESATSTAAASASQATAAMSKTVSVVRERLVAGEQLALSGAGLIVAVWIIWDLIFDVRPGTIDNFTLLIAVLTVLAIWVHRWGHYDFGNGYRIVLGALGLALALFAVSDLLLTFRRDINIATSSWLGNLLFWIGGIVAGYGAWLVFRIREDS